MANIRTIDMQFLDELFGMQGGYVLQFSNASFSRFFAEELNIDIDDPRYAEDGSSKGKRLRFFLRSVDGITAARTLKALWDYREAVRMNTSGPDLVKNAHGRLLTLINKLEGGVEAPSPFTPVPAFDTEKISKLNAELIGLYGVEPHTRGYAFERFLKALFDLYKLDARDPFRNRGEQIDGSFVLANEVYLLEAKWHASPTGAGDLHAFHGKLEQKAPWARGIFISYNGFTEDGLHAFGRAKRVVCIEGLDLHDALRREIPFPSVLTEKIRKAGESGNPFVRVRDLFPE
ncbi:restriction endonuclease [Xanthobacter sp. VTT E-85241]|uniref:restriction endonuclease n=1 Tax=Roseixanthobacter finlandensis TaxID=3119922 RepID=UPI0037291F54